MGVTVVLLPGPWKDCKPQRTWLGSCWEAEPTEEWLGLLLMSEDESPKWATVIDLM